MADAADSKSVALKSVRVQVPPPALSLLLVNQRSQGFSFAEKGSKRCNTAVVCLHRFQSILPNIVQFLCIQAAALI